MFFTNYDSRKGRDLAAHPYAALVLFWEPLHRQVRVEGAIERVADRRLRRVLRVARRAAASSARSRRRSRSRSRSRAALEQRVADVARKHGDARARARPAYWGGYRVVPEMIELWQGQPSRLHDRVRYRRERGAWVKDRLAP